MIVLSAGHHPSSPGVWNSSMVEHEEAVIWANYIMDYMKSEVQLLPRVVTKEKISLINNIKDIKIAVEVHFDDCIENRPSVLYDPDSEISKQYAYKIQEAFSKVVEGVEICEGWYKGDVKRGVDFFLDMTICTAVIIVAGSIKHADEIRDYRQEACWAIAKVLQDVGQNKINN